MSEQHHVVFNSETEEFIIVLDKEKAESLCNMFNTTYAFKRKCAWDYVDFGTYCTWEDWAAEFTKKVLEQLPV